MRATVPPALDEQLVSPAFYQDPYPFYDRLRAEAPVAWSETLGAWILTRYEHVQATLYDPRRFSSQGRLSAALESSDEVRIAREKLRQDLDGDVAPELRIAGAIHLTHPAGADAVCSW